MSVHTNHAIVSRRNQLLSPNYQLLSPTDQFLDRVNVNCI